MSKKKDFLVSNLIIIAFILVGILALNYTIMATFTLNKEIYFVSFVILVVFGVWLYYVLSKAIFDDLFKSNQNIDYLVKQTLHELNTPVATIKANLTMLKKNEYDEKTLQRLGRIEFASDKLYELYEFMEHEIKSKIGKISPQNIDLKQIIEKSIAKHIDINKRVTITSMVPSLILFCDRVGLEKTIDNLLSNAIKYNHNGGFVQFSLNGTVLEIADNGKGIDTKNLFTIFDAYFQEDNSKSGFGMGLTIVKDFCDKNKIPIKLSSSSQGTCFYLDLKFIILNNFNNLSATSAI